MHQVAVGRGVRGHSLDAQFLAGAKDAKGDFATVGDQYFFQHGGVLLVGWRQLGQQLRQLFTQG